MSENEQSLLQIFFVSNDEKETKLSSNRFSVVKPWLVGQLQQIPDV